MRTDIPEWTDLAEPGRFALRVLHREAGRWVVRAGGRGYLIRHRLAGAADGPHVAADGGGAGATADSSWRAAASTSEGAQARRARG